jgi:hypothetical protein
MWICPRVLSGTEMLTPFACDATQVSSAVAEQATRQSGNREAFLSARPLQQGKNDSENSDNI